MTASDPLIGTEVAGYLVEERLGRGAVGVVYRAKQLSLKRTVALKRLSPALAHDEFQVSERDMLWATLFALFTTALIFFYAFRSWARPLLGFSCLIFSVILTFGLTTITIGYLNLISLTFAVILIGLGTQYGIHIIARYEEERGRDRSIADTVQILFSKTVPSLLIGALTTAAAFYSTLCYFHGVCSNFTVRLFSFSCPNVPTARSSQPEYSSVNVGTDLQRGWSIPSLPSYISNR